MLAVIVAATVALQGSDLSVLGLVGDGAVLQRGSPIEVAGNAAADARILVTLDGDQVRTRAGDDGRWSVTLPARRAGGPHDLTVRSSDEVLSASDVMIGDVLLCSGQSNMEYPVERALNADWEAARTYPNIRLFTVPKAYGAEPAETFGEPARWQAAEGTALAEFSAVCVFAARALKTDPAVTIGLVDASWGGSRIEAWMTQEALEAAGSYEDGLATLRTYVADPQAGMAAFGRAWEGWYETATSTRPWADDEALSGWQVAPAGLGDWNEWDQPRLDGHRGIVWYRASVDLTAADLGAPASLLLGVADDADTAWVNGRFVGHTRSWSETRDYEIPEEVLREGPNEILVAVENGWGSGGLLATTAQTGVRIGDDLIAPDAWSVTREREDIGSPPVVPWTATSGLGSLRNGMIAPIGRPALAGLIWYQGESNAGEAGKYGDLLEAAIGSWRDAFGAELPVAVVQLTGYGSLPPPGPSPSGWADLREAQRRVAVADPLTGLVVTTDVGDRFDIHPANKQAVGVRAAAVLEAIVSSKEADGGSPTSATSTEDSVIVALQDGVSATPAGTPSVYPVELCEDDRRCVSAPAVIEDGRLVIEAAGPASFVRYCWADMPICNLFDAGGTPITPFEVEIDR